MRSYKWLDPPLHNHCADGVASRDPCHFPCLSINRDVSAPDTLWEPVTDLRRVTARGLKGGKCWVRCLRRLGNQDRRRWWFWKAGFSTYLALAQRPCESNGSPLNSILTTVDCWALCSGGKSVTTLHGLVWCGWFIPQGFLNLGPLGISKQRCSSVFICVNLQRENLSDLQ